MNPLACDLSGLPVIRRDDDELDEAYEQRRRNSKTKRRSRTQRVGTKEDLVPELTEQGYSSEKQEEDRIIEQNNRTMEQGSSTTTTSTSSSGAQGEILPFLLSPEKSPNNHHYHVTNGHKNARTRPPLPASRTSSNKYNANSRERDRTYANDNMYRTHHQVQRSSSNGEFQRVNQRKPLEL